ncbi:MAG: hypothetical protein J7J36_05010 [Thermoplasmata archaeon]|nr:hypothetical protein [Thermoplasmata archaeon]
MNEIKKYRGMLKATEDTEKDIEELRNEWERDAYFLEWIKKHADKEFADLLDEAEEESRKKLNLENER